MSDHPPTEEGRKESPEAEKQELPEALNSQLRLLGLDPEKPEVRELMLRVVAYSFSGPVPPPELLKAYDAVIPGLADRLIRRTEKQSDHRMDLEKLVVSSQQKESDRGQVFALILAILFLTACVLLALTGHDTVAGIVGGMDIVGLVTVFVLGRKKQKKDLEEKTLQIK